jgi:hypothetical protein
MRALVVYESMFGNTETIARAIADGLGELYEVTTTEVGSAPERLPGDVALLVVGGPTHAMGLTRPNTREQAAAEVGNAGLVSRGRGLREWLEALEPAGSLPAATFDTHIDKPFPGSASRAARRRLRALGFDVRRAESFHVRGTTGPLTDGEPARAHAWAARLAAELAASRSSQALAEEAGS